MTVFITLVLCVVCVNVGSPGNGESSLRFLHLYQCNSINLQSLTYSEQNELSFKGSFVQQPKINFIPYSYFQHYIYMADSPIGLCLSMYIEDLYTNIYSVRIAVYI